MAHRILLLTGMTPDARIFDRILPLLPTAAVVPWIAPEAREPLTSYAKRLAGTIAERGSLIVCGVSFGGIIARELALHLNAITCVLISSVRNARQLPPWIRCLRPLARFDLESALKRVGTAAVAYPKPIRTESTTRLTKLAGDAGAWHRWASASVLRWSASPELDRIPTIQIHGDRDATLPVRYVRPEVVIPGGGHVLPLTHGTEIAAALAEIAAASKSL